MIPSPLPRISPEFPASGPPALRTQFARGLRKRSRSDLLDQREEWSESRKKQKGVEFLPQSTEARRGTFDRPHAASISA